MSTKTAIRRALGDVNSERAKRLIARMRNRGPLVLLRPMKVNQEFQVSRFALSGQEVFFGYYDKRQLSIDGRRLLACAVNSRSARMSEPSDSMTVGYFDTTTRQFHNLAETATYNWQQACMLRWVPNSGDARIAFNSHRTNCFVTEVVNSDTGVQLDEIPYATYDWAPSGAMIATCDFSRLHVRRRGYGYWQDWRCRLKRAPDDAAAVMASLYDIRRRKTIRTISLGELLGAIQADVNVESVYVNHLSFSPSSTKLLLFLFWGRNESQRMAALFYDIAADTVRLITRNYMSHFCWETDSALVAWGVSDEGKYGYFRYSLSSQSQSEYWLDGANTDGHCTILSDGRLLADTYPDACGFQRLFTRDTEGAIEAILSIHSPARFAFDRRCDLHPRATSSLDCYTFDSAVGGRRATYMVARK